MIVTDGISSFQVKGSESTWTQIHKRRAAVGVETYVIVPIVYSKGRNLHRIAHRQFIATPTPPEDCRPLIFPKLIIRSIPPPQVHTQDRQNHVDVLSTGLRLTRALFCSPWSLASPQGRPSRLPRPTPRERISARPVRSVGSVGIRASDGSMARAGPLGHPACHIRIS